MKMTAAEKIATSPSVTAAVRVAMFLTPVLVSVSLFVLGNYLAGQAQAMQTFTERVESVEDVTVSLGSRVSTVETRISIGQQQREKFQDQILAALAQLQQQNLETQKAIARLETSLSK